MTVGPPETVEARAEGRLAAGLQTAERTGAFTADAIIVPVEMGFLDILADWQDAAEHVTPTLERIGQLFDTMGS